MNTYDVKPVKNTILNPEVQEEEKESTLRNNNNNNMMANTITPTREEQKVEEN